MRHNYAFAAVVAILLTFCSCNRAIDPVDDEQPSSQDSTEIVVPQDNIYQFSVLDGHDNEVSLSLYEGKVLLVVNTATRCGYTPQYTELQKIYETYGHDNFVILDFPCNQFGSQAPGSYDDIHEFCTANYNITFPQFAKIEVNGQNASPLYVWLKSKKGGDIQWNFTKFLINKKGEVVKRFEPNHSLTAVENAIKYELEM